VGDAREKARHIAATGWTEGVGERDAKALTEAVDRLLELLERLEGDGTGGVDVLEGAEGGSEQSAEGAVVVGGGWEGPLEAAGGTGGTFSPGHAFGDVLGADSGNGLGGGLLPGHTGSGCERKGGERGPDERGVGACGDLGGRKRAGRQLGDDGTGDRVGRHGLRRRRCGGAGPGTKGLGELGPQALPEGWGCGDRPGSRFETGGVEDGRGGTDQACRQRGRGRFGGGRTVEEVAAVDQ